MEGKMGWVGNTLRRDEKCTQNFVENLKGRDSLGDRIMNGMTILERVGEYGLDSSG
jgi:hypothetical protein